MGPEVFTSFLSTILHPSIYQEIYISSPRFYIPSRNIGFLSTFLHSTTYNEQPTHTNSRNKIKNEDIQQSRKSSQEKEKKSRTNIFKIPPYNLLGPAKFQIKFLINQNTQKISKPNKQINIKIIDFAHMNWPPKTIQYKHLYKYR